VFIGAAGHLVAGSPVRPSVPTTSLDAASDYIGIVNDAGGWPP
jgi:hypothetical protein